jgi:hypothetical protein
LGAQKLPIRVDLSANNRDLLKGHASLVIEDSVGENVATPASKTTSSTQHIETID